MNKKGQGGITIETVVGVLAVVLFVILLIYTVNKFFDKTNTAMDSQNERVQLAVGHCNSNYKNFLGGGPTDEDTFVKYCASFSSIEVPVGSVKSYVTCAFMEKQKVTVFSEDSVSNAIKNKCTDEYMRKVAYDKCIEYNNTYVGSDRSWKVYLNGMECSKKTAQDRDSLLRAFGLTDKGGDVKESGTFGVADDRFTYDSVEN